MHRKTRNDHVPSRRRFLWAGVAGLAGLSGLKAAHPLSKFGILDQSAPGLTVSYWIDRDGRPTTFELASVRGKWVFLKCFQNWCPGCHSHGFPALKKIADALVDNQGVVIAGIQTVFEGFGSNTQDAVRALQLRYELPIIMGHDPGDPDGEHRPSTMRNYRTGGTPWMILIDPQGFVVFNDFYADPDRLIAFLSQETA
jgi:thiol-disulfide isomerase/thioredoxin